jgi:hypothetical protein
MIITDKIQIDFFSQTNARKRYKFIQISPDISYSWDTQYRQIADSDRSFESWDELSFYFGWINWTIGFTISFKYSPK